MFLKKSNYLKIGIFVFNFLHLNALEKCRLDPSFGVAGKVVTSVGATDFAEGTIVTQPDNKILIAGTSDNKFCVIRYNENGSLDTQFGSGGIVTTSFFTGLTQGYGLALQSDGKIIVSGTTNDGVNTYFALARYKTNGDIDTTFGTAGKVTTLFTPGLPPPGLGQGTVSRAVAVQSDGNIVATGVTLGDFVTTFLVMATARYDINGDLDTTFGTGGKVTTDVGLLSEATSMVIQNDTKIVIAGLGGGLGSSNFALVRYETNGSLDLNFGTNGIVITDVSPGFNNAALDLTLIGTQLLAVGLSNVEVNGSQEIFKGNVALVKYNNDGSLDTNFGNLGIVTTQIGSNASLAKGVKIQADGKIIIVGGTDVIFPAQASIPYELLTQGKLLAARYNANGNLDNTFGNGGLIITDMGNPAISTDVDLQDTKIVASGILNNLTDRDFLTVRYFCDITTFVTITFPTNNQTVNNNKPTITGTTEIGNTVLVSFNGGTKISANVDSNGNWSIISPTQLPEGNNTVTAFATDNVGNKAQASVSFKVDTITFVTITSPTNNQTVNNSMPIIIGTTEIGNTVLVSFNGGTKISANVDSNGNWSIISPTQLPEGNNTVTAFASDSVGNTAQTSVSFKVDTTTFVTITSPINNQIINNNKPTITGTTEIGNNVLVSFNGGTMLSANVDSNGNWSIISPTQLPEGNNTVTAFASDSLGNTAQTSISFIVDTKTFVEITSPKKGQVITTNQFTIRGKSEPGNTIKIFIDGKFIGQTISSDNGKWIFNASINLTNCNHVILAKAIDKLGNKAQDEVTIFVNRATDPFIFAMLNKFR